MVYCSLAFFAMCRQLTSARVSGSQRCTVGICESVKGHDDSSIASLGSYVVPNRSRGQSMVRFDRITCHVVESKSLVRRNSEMHATNRNQPLDRFNYFNVR